MVWWIQRQHACLRKEPDSSRIYNSKERRNCVIYFLLKYCTQIISPSRVTTANTSSKAFAQVLRGKGEAIAFVGLEYQVTNVYIPSTELCKQRSITCPVLFLCSFNCQRSFCWFCSHSQGTCLPVSEKSRAENNCLKKQVTSTLTKCFSCFCSAFSLFPSTPPR